MINSNKDKAKYCPDNNNINCHHNQKMDYDLLVDITVNVFPQTTIILI